MNDAITRTDRPGTHPPSMRKDLRSFLGDWARWSSAERRAATLFLVLVAVAPIVHFLPS